MKRIKIILVNLCLLLFSLSSYSQTKTITGNVQDGKEPLIGVNIMIKGSDIGDASDVDGNFTITGVSNNDILVFSYTGYQSQEVPVGDQTVLNITLLEAASALSEITVVGYGTKKKSNVVGSVTSVDIEEATALPTTNVSEMLRGRAAGVQVNLSDARPGGNSNIVIRGNVSVAPNGNDPLIIVDGLPFDNLNDVVPDDIASIEILKDASSTAIMVLELPTELFLLPLSQVRKVELV
ncbi:MAG: TonB-dependent receptor plug domain-containing protein [Saprospiraceae bacterium]